jgi:hypothetical protein
VGGCWKRFSFSCEAWDGPSWQDLPGCPQYLHAHVAGATHATGWMVRTSTPIQIGAHPASWSVGTVLLVPSLRMCGVVPLRGDSFISVTVLPYISWLHDYASSIRRAGPRYVLWLYRTCPGGVGISSAYCYWSIKTPRGIPLIKNIIVIFVPFYCLQGVTETCRQDALHWSGCCWGRMWMGGAEEGS